MKFISKNSNLHIILQPGQQFNPVTQTPPIPALSVRFQNGQADITDEAIVTKMLAHPACNQDFIVVDDVGTDPYAYRRAGSEPQHVTTEIKYGHPIGRSTTPISTPLPPELKKLIAEQATAIATEMVKAQMPELMKEALKAVMTVQSQTLSENKDNEPDVEQSETNAKKPEILTPSKPKAKGTK